MFCLCECKLIDFGVRTRLFCTGDYAFNDNDGFGMIWQMIIIIDRMPLLMNGKLDRQKLLKMYEHINNTDRYSVHETQRSTNTSAITQINKLFMNPSNRLIIPQTPRDSST